jgi:hypothetical protein
LLLRHARPQGRSSPGATESSFACARVTSCRAEPEDRRGAGNILPTVWGQTVEGGAAPRKGECRPAMEGTSGAAECAHLRGWVCEAALSRNACGSRGRDARRRASVGERGEPWEARATASPASSSSPDFARHGSRQEVLESIGSGPSSPRERSRWERLRRGRHCRANHATPDPWNLGWPARASEMGHPQPGTRSKGCDPGEKLHQRATAGVVLRSSDIRGRVRGSFRLQKSTGGARHRSPACEERAAPERCLAILRESKGWRTGPGSRRLVAKRGAR